MCCYIGVVRRELIRASNRATGPLRDPFENGLCKHIRCLTACLESIGLKATMCSSFGANPDAQSGSTDSTDRFIGSYVAGLFVHFRKVGTRGRGVFNLLKGCSDQNLAVCFLLSHSFKRPF